MIVLGQGHSVSILTSACGSRWLRLQWLSCLCLGLVFFSAVAESARQLVRVGTPERPPLYIEGTSQHMSTGILQAMNQVQQQYRFELVGIPVKRRSHAIDQGSVDIVMWDNPAWEWQIPLAQSLPLLHAKDIFIARRDRIHGPAFFQTLTDKTIAAVHGYTYDFLESARQRGESVAVVLVKSEETSIKMLMAQRVDLAVTSSTALAWYLRQHPEHRAQIVVGERPDYIYQRSFLVPPSSPISVVELNRILRLADRQGLIEPVYRQFDLAKPDFD